MSAKDNLVAALDGYIIHRLFFFDIFCRILIGCTSFTFAVDRRTPDF